jgi:hypothetical protein
VRQRRCLPAVLEAEDLGASRHRVERQILSAIADEPVILPRHRGARRLAILDGWNGRSSLVERLRDEARFPREPGRTQSKGLP